MKTEDKICKKCRYFDSFLEDDYSIGLCSRYPPRIMLNANDTARMFRPEMQEYEYCGEFKKVRKRDLL